MNSIQRKFLVDRINTKVDEKIKNLRDSLEEFPSASNYIFKAIMSDKLKLKSEAHILSAIKAKALSAKEGTNWLSDERMGMNKENTIKLLLKDLIELPEDFHEQKNLVSENNRAILKEIEELKIQKETLEVRIQLASDKTLCGLIQEVDDMGDLKLVDAKLKLIN